MSSRAVPRFLSAVFMVIAGFFLNFFSDLISLVLVMLVVFFEKIRSKCCTGCSFVLSRCPSTYGGANGVKILFSLTNFILRYIRPVVKVCWLFSAGFVAERFAVCVC